MAKVKESETSFDIYSVENGTERGLVQVSDPLHQLILRKLSKGPMSTSEISELTHKAQSTLSVHLDQMVTQNLIKSEYDKNDSRRKIFHITSKRIASSKATDLTGVEEAMSMLSATAKEPNLFYRGLFKSVLMSAEANGMDVCPMMEMLGANLAENMSQKIGTGKVEDVIRQIQDFYERNEMGEVCIYTFLPLTIIIHDPDETQYKFESFAAFSHGLFTALLSRVTGRKYEITMSEIFGTGNNYYKFIIELAP